MAAASLRKRASDEAALVVGLGGFLGELEVCLEGGEWRADLVGGVGDKPAQRAHRDLDALGHAVEGVGQEADLVVPLPLDPGADQA